MRNSELRNNTVLGHHEGQGLRNKKLAYRRERKTGKFVFFVERNLCISGPFALWKRQFRTLPNVPCRKLILIPRLWWLRSLQHLKRGPLEQ